MKRFLPGLWSAVLPPLFLAQSAWAQPRPVPVRLNPAQVQQLTGALTRFDSQDFFSQGREQFEDEIKRLAERRLFLSDGVLKISRDLQIQQELSPFEQPDVVSPQPVK